MNAKANDILSLVDAMEGVAVLPIGMMSDDEDNEDGGNGPDDGSDDPEESNAATEEGVSNDSATLPSLPLPTDKPRVNAQQAGRRHHQPQTRRHFSPQDRVSGSAALHHPGAIATMMPAPLPPSIIHPDPSATSMSLNGSTTQAEGLTVQPQALIVSQAPERGMETALEHSMATEQASTTAVAVLPSIAPIVVSSAPEPALDDSAGQQQPVVPVKPRRGRPPKRVKAAVPSAASPNAESSD
jgi:hypothetical protein